MSDFLLELGKKSSARRVIKTLGLPIPVPQVLKRARGPLEERPLDDENVLVGSAPGSTLLHGLASALCEAGAEPKVIGPPGILDAFAASGEAFGRPAAQIEPEAITEGTLQPRAMVFDASGVTTIAGLRELYDFFRPVIKSLPACGRIVVVGRPVDSAPDPEAAAACSALTGFVRTVAKEIGRKGSTANLLLVDPGAEERIPAPIRFLLTPRSAFVSGQPLRVSVRAKQALIVAWERPLDGRVALVTGAARGIGAATARRLAAEGARVVCLDRPDDDVRLSRLARDIGGEVLLVDVTDDDAPARIAETLDALGGVQVVIHNAGITRDKTLARMDPEPWDQVLDVNLGAVARITEALLDGPLLDRARIVCLSSVAGIAGNVGQSNYAASKAGLIGFVESLAEEVADRGVTVNGIAPGFIETRMTARIPPMIREAGRRLAALGQGGQPSDVAEALTFLSTPGADGVTGQILRVCGGAFIGA